MLGALLKPSLYDLYMLWVTLHKYYHLGTLYSRGAGGGGAMVIVYLLVNAALNVFHGKNYQILSRSVLDHHSL